MIVKITLFIHSTPRSVALALVHLDDDFKTPLEVCIGMKVDYMKQKGCKNVFFLQWKR
jgi:hypothetical protein